MKFGGGDSKEKPKGAVGLLVGAPAPDSDPMAMPETDHGFKAVARAFGIPPEREAAAKAALEQFVRTCKSADYDDEEEGEGL